jgi:hypothetical protein
MPTIRRILNVLRTIALSCGIAGIVLVGAHRAHAAELAVEPAQQRLTVGEQFEAAIVLRANNSALDGIDVRSLQYDPSRLRLAGDSETPVRPGPALAELVRASADREAGAVQLSGILSDEAGTGSSTVGTVRFEATRAGTTTLSLSYEPGATTESNVAASGTDVLRNVYDATYRIAAREPWWRRWFSSLLWWS